MLLWLVRSALPEPAVVFLDDYHVEQVGPIEVLWDPRFEEEHRLEVAAAVAADLAHLGVEGEGVRVVVTLHGPELEAFPPGGNGIWLWSGPDWLTAAGLDAERAGAIEIWGVDRYLELVEEHPDLLAQNVRRVSGPPSHPLLPDLDEYVAEERGAFVVLWHGEPDPEVRAALEEDLGVIESLIPAKALDELRGTRVIVNQRVETSRGGVATGRYYHVDPAWFEQHGLDAGRVGSVEIYDARAWLAERSDHPMGLLHELAHKRVAQASPAVRAQLAEAYAAAEASGRYESVAYALADHEARAYALTSEGEYAAELSEAWFGRNEYYPFTREELLRFDPLGAELVRALWSVEP